MRKNGIFIIAFVFVIKTGFAQVDSARPGIDTPMVTLAAGKQYAASGWHKIWWGKHYRNEWTTPVSFPTLDISVYQGGLKPTKVGGGHESKTLRLKSASGQEFVLRTMDKDLNVLIPEEFKNTFINTLVNDQISTAHPYGPLAIAPMADQLGLMHTNPIIVYVPDDTALGEFRNTFANKLCLLEERPSGDGWEHTALSGNADKVINTEDLLEKVRSNTKNSIDAPTFLRIRMFDMIINDWDRHEDQWVWTAHEKGDGTFYIPFGRDRDQAFSKTDGLAVWFLSRPWALRPLQNMSSRVKDILGSNFSARFLDRQFLTGLSRKEWLQQISFIQSNLTDSGIQKAVDNMPKEANKFSGAFVSKRLKQRRDNLSGYGMRYYAILSKRIAVAGSDKKEHFIIDNNSNRSVIVTGLGHNEDTFYHREFYRSETKEINIYGLDGDDEFTFTGNSSNPFTLRIIGGIGNKKYTASNETGKGKKIRIYDSLYNENLSRGKFHITRKSDSLYRYKRNWVKYDWYVPLIIPAYNPDDGFAIGLGFLYKKQQWGKTPFGWQQQLVINYATGTSALGFGYRGTFKQAVGKWDFDVTASYKGPRFVLNYYGLGNNTELTTKTKSFYRVKSKIFVLNPGLSHEWKHSYFQTSLHYESVNVLPDQNKFITSSDAGVDPEIFEARYFGGINGEWDLYTNASRRNPQNGVRFESGYSYLHEFNADTKDLLQLHSSLSFYLTLAKVITLAHRTGAETNFGDYEFYHASTLGGHTNLRGYWRDRFAGRSSVYQNSELRLKLAHLKGYVLRGQLGLIGFFDDGRVWEDGKSSSTIHTGYGGGFYFLPFNTLALNFYYAKSKETGMFVLRTGFFF